ncbi:MAG: hypothetical protein P1U53_01145 [Sulfitobacter sp.]|nr:hypothetical protein [Sulfitobacter sp.]
MMQHFFRIRSFHFYQLCATIAIICLVSSTNSIAFAADITKQISAKMRDAGCTVMLSGIITSGDSKKIRPLLYETYEISLSDDGQYGETLCLNSPGGDLNEALIISNYIYEYHANTLIPSSAKCESACAIMFLSARSRTIVPPGTVGLHAPQLQLPDGNFTAQDVAKAYDLSVLAVKRMLDIPVFPPAALRHISSTPFSDMFIPKTMFEIYELDIIYRDMDARRVPVKDLMEAGCRWAFWESGINPGYYSNPGDKAMEFDEFTHVHTGERTANTKYDPVTERKNTESYVSAVYSVHDGEETWFPCAVELNYGEFGLVTKVLYAGEEYTFSAKQLYPWDSSYLDVAKKPVLSKTVFDSIIGGIRTPGSETRSCQIETTASQVTNVSEYTNLREKPGLGNQVIARVPLGAEVNHLSPGQYFATQRCLTACQSDQQGLISECVDGNEVWIEVSYSGRRGFLSRKFLQ